MRPHLHFAILTAIVGSISAGSLQPYNNWAISLAKADEILAQLSLPEIANITIEKSVSGFTQTQYIDGPNGMVGPLGGSGWVSGQTIASSFDRSLITAQFTAMALEFRNKGYGQQLGPVTGPLGRSVFSGRLFEGMGTDPYLNGKLYAAAVKAVLAQGVQATGKHYFGNEQETDRTEVPVRTSSNIDDRTTHMTYLWPWIDAVNAGITCIMCVMNRVNGTQGCENYHILTELLKGELNYQGWIIPDATAIVNNTAAVLAGLDDDNTDDLPSLLARIQNGTIPESIIRDHARRIIAAQLNVNAPVNTLPSLTSVALKNVKDPNSKTLIRQIGAQSIVLLKNTNNALPLKKANYIALFGKNAANLDYGASRPEDVFNYLGDTYDSHLASGGGSGLSQTPYIVSPLDAFNTRVQNNQVIQLRYILSDNFTLTSSSSGPFGPGASVSLYAAAADTCLVFLNAYAKEGVDREALFDPVGDLLVNNVANNCNATIVIINGAGARLVDGFVNHPNVTAILNAGLLGDESGNAISDVLFGDINPSGRLPYTIAKSAVDYNGQICPCCECNYTEGMYIDYKHFDQAGIQPRYEFGFGLSYTTFTYSNPKANFIAGQHTLSATAGGLLGMGGYASLFDVLVQASIDVENSGIYDGKEITQLYVQFPAAANLPLRELRGFEATYLKKGQGQTVQFSLQRRDLSDWNVETQKWTLVPGSIVLLFARSSRDFIANLTVSLPL